MTLQDPHDDDHEVAPPPELVRLRNLLVRGPSPDTRARHLAAATAATGRRPLAAMGPVATWGARVAVGLVASLVIITGLAGAPLLPQPAQRLLSTVSARFAPAREVPLTVPTEPAGGTTQTGNHAGGPRRATATVEATEPADSLATPTSTAAVKPAPSTTIPGPTGPGSPADPTDPGAATTTTTEPEPTTTTTAPGSTTTTTEAASP